MYYAGQGVPPDYAEARKWYRLAADQGNADAQTILGLMYHFGQGVPQDYAEAEMVSPRRRSGHASAQHSLGHMSSEVLSPTSRYPRAMQAEAAPRPRSGIASPPIRATPCAGQSWRHVPP